MTDFKNEFSWSFSRHGTFTSCKLKYYYSYYGSWGGWKSDADATIRKLYTLKNMTNLPMLAGDVVHKTINTVLESLKKGGEIPVERARDRTIQMFKKAWKESKDREWVQMPKRKANLFEHYYQEDLPDNRLMEIHDTMVRSIDGFYHSDSLAFIRTLSPNEWLTKEEFDTFDFEGVKIWVKLDFAARHAEKIYIYDWKTGKEVRENEMQLAVYALYAMNRWGISLKDLRLFDIYVKKQLPIKVKINQAIIQQAQKEIKASILDMTSLLEDVAENRADMEKFPMVESTNICRRCVYKEICYPESWKDL